MNFGTVNYEPGRGHARGHWYITCDAHVRTKLKRLFPEVNQRAGEKIALSDNEENCRDLLWFLDRYPMTTDHLEHLKSRAELHVEHYLISEDGSDPIIADILGIKRGQIEGVINPEGDLIERLGVDAGYIKRLASDYLNRMGIELPVQHSLAKE